MRVAQSDTPTCARECCCATPLFVNASGDGTLLLPFTVYSAAEQPSRAVLACARARTVLRHTCRSLVWRPRSLALAYALVTCPGRAFLPFLLRCFLLFSTCSSTAKLAPLVKRSCTLLTHVPVLFCDLAAVIGSTWCCRQPARQVMSADAEPTAGDDPEEEGWVEATRYRVPRKSFEKRVYDEMFGAHCHALNSMQAAKRMS